MNKNLVIGIIGLFVVLGIFFVLNSREEGTRVNDQNIATSTEEVAENVEDQETMDVKIALIALEGAGAPNGKEVGCGDTIAMVNREVPYTQATLQAALTELLNLSAREVGPDNFYNSLADSDLSIENIVIENGVADISLSGTYSLGGTCDTPRFQAQLEETALQFSTIEDVNITLNGETLEDALSSQ